jgi:hypothetical protein
MKRDDDGVFFEEHEAPTIAEVWAALGNDGPPPEPQTLEQLEAAER